MEHSKEKCFEIKLTEHLKTIFSYNLFVNSTRELVCSTCIWKTILCFCPKVVCLCEMICGFSEILHAIETMCSVCLSCPKCIKHIVTKDHEISNIRIYALFIHTKQVCLYITYLLIKRDGKPHWALSFGTVRFG